MIQEEALKEQHKNTRHDAVEVMAEIQDRYSDKYKFPDAAYQMCNEMIGAVMNLKQRKPKNYEMDNE